MTEDDKKAVAKAKAFLEASRERKDHAMRYWAYEWDAEQMAHYITTGKWIDDPKKLKK